MLHHSQQIRLKRTMLVEPKAWSQAAWAGDRPAVQVPVQDWVQLLLTVLVCSPLREQVLLGEHVWVRLGERLQVPARERDRVGVRVLVFKGPAQQKASLEPAACPRKRVVALPDPFQK